MRKKCKICKQKMSYTLKHAFGVGIVFIIIGAISLASSMFFGSMIILLGILCLVFYKEKYYFCPSCKPTRNVNNPSSIRTNKKKPSLKRIKDIGASDLFCPYCKFQFDKKLTRKRQCPECKKQIIIRKSILDDTRKVALREDQLDDYEEQCSIADGTHSEYKIKKTKYENKKMQLSKQFGFTPPHNDIQWGLYCDELISYASRREWTNYIATKHAMAKQLFLEKKDSACMQTYLEIIYLELNSPDIDFDHYDIDKVGQDQPYYCKWSSIVGIPRSFTLEKIIKVISRANVELEDIKKIFFECNSRQCSCLKTPLSIKKAWKIFEKEIVL